MDTINNTEKVASTNAGATSKGHISVFVLIDALGWQFINGREFLQDLLPNRSPLRTVLGFSSGAIPSILTGVNPTEHGHWNLFYYDPQNSPFRWLRHLRFLPDTILDTRITRKLIKEMGKRIFGFGPLFECCVSPRLMPYFNWVEKRNIYHQRGITGADSIFDQLAQRRVPYCAYTYHDATDDEIIERALHDIRGGKGRFFFLYLSEMDGFLHMHCNEPREIDERLRRYDRGLRQVFDAAREADPDATFAVFSDHGMTPVRNHFDVVSAVENLNLKMPGDYLSVYDSTMARFWFFNQQAERKVRDALDQITCGRILSDLELKELGILFPDRRYGQLIFLMDAGWLMARSDFHGQWLPLGMHGYHPDDAYSDAVFLSNRNSRQCSTIKDVYYLMEEAAR